MIKTYAVHNNHLKKIEYKPGEISGDAVWIDLMEPTLEEEKEVEKFLGIELPTKEEMKEIELSNRFYEEEGALYMTAAILAKSDTEEADAYEITFILSDNKLITIRYVEPTSFRLFTSQKQKCTDNASTGVTLLAGLLGAFINRIADITEKVDKQIDVVSGQIFKSTGFKHGRKSTNHFQRIIKELGLAGDLISKTQESLVSIQRLVSFLLPQLTDVTRKNMVKRFDFIVRDSIALREHTSYLIDKVNFLLDATLGLINIQQNDIMKLFSVAAVCFMPGTLITGFFGMNFDRLPLLHWYYGYELSIAAIVASIVIPFMLFRRKGWL